MDIKPFNRAHEASKWWRPPDFRWQYATYALVGIAVVVTVGIFLLPKDAQNSRVDEAFAADKARKARIAAWVENPGDVMYIEPGTNPFLPPPSMREKPPQ